MSFWILAMIIGFFWCSAAALGSVLMSLSTCRMMGSCRMPWISGSAIARACLSFISASSTCPVLPRWISIIDRLSPSLSSSFSGSCLRPSWYVSSALSNCFVKNSTWPLRVYPLAKSGFSSMHFSASFSASLNAASFV